MTEKELIAEYANKTECTQSEAKERIDTLINLIVDSTMDSGKCAFGKVGTFKRVDVKETPARLNVANPMKPGTFYDIAAKPARTKLAFALSKSGKLIGA